MRRFRRVLLLAIGGLFLLCVAAGAISALSNRNLPSGPQVLDRLDPLDKARLAETLHLKQELSEAVWPGWGQADIPVIIWNHDYSFLVGYPHPPAEWEAVAGDTFEGQTYYRQRSNNPQNFALQVGDRWVARMATKWETDLFMRELFRKVLPPLIEDIFPYLVLIQPSEVQMSAVLHESFHAYQAIVAAARLAAAEKAHQEGQKYQAADEQMHDDWGKEIDLLARALRAKSDSEAADLARQFLAQRAQRRTAHSLDATLVAYERQLEWEEGLAKYVELAVWRVAYTTPGYQPLSTLANDRDFKGYATFEQRWSQEVDQMKRQASDEGETRFYYTGMAQATLLDRLLPGWKARALADEVWLEDLLAEAVK
jgi:hypothetical protein